MEENRAAPRKRKKKRVTVGRVILGIFKVLGTLLVIGILTGLLFYRTFMKYVETTLEPEMDVDASAYTLKQSSTIYYQDKASGEWVELQKIHGVENRTLVNYDQIPDHVVKALVAIEDERFYEHKGVDWKSTLGQVYNMLTGNNVRGASTITQQVIKNLTGENQVTIRRKILEIFRALRFHEKYSEEDILEIYFNKVYFGEQAYGIEAAAETYFGKHVEDLTVAEGAAIVGITQNPWQYDPLRSEWSREQNRSKQLLVLSKMNELGYLTDSQYAAAKNEKMVFVGDEDYVEEPETTGEEEGDTVTTNEDLDSFFVEQVFRDVVAAFMAMDYSKETASDMIYNGGYRIYCTLDPDIQDYIEEVYADRSNFNYTSASGQQIQSGMTIIDNRTNNIVAIAGRVGEREGALEWSYAASTSPCGSAIKPLSVYAPAIDAGILSAASVIDDYPITLNGDIWPTNAYRGYRGLLTIQDALRISSNTTAVRTFQRLTPSASYAFMAEKLGFTTLVSDDLAPGALALGGLTNGVSTIEMAAAYSTFANNGVYTSPRTFTEVRDSYGNVVIDNTQDTWVAMKESTVYTINELLKNVVRSGGTGSSAAFSGMTMAGKTGTTNSKRDRYFVGYTAYYTAAVWCGYPIPERINTDDNPAALAWNKVMSHIHEGLNDRDFPTTSEGMVSVTVCNKTGLRAGSGCSSTRTVLVPQGMAPSYVCDAHVGIEICSESGLLAGEFCPEDLRTTVYAIDLTQPNTAAGFGYVRSPVMTSLSGEQYELYAAQVEAGLRDSIPDGAALAANDSDSFAEVIRSRGYCILHTEEGEETDDPDNSVDPDNPDEAGDPEHPDNPLPADNPDVSDDPGVSTDPNAQGEGESGDSGEAGTEEPGGEDEPAIEDLPTSVDDFVDWLHDSNSSSGG